SAWATQRRTDSRATPNCLATAAIASVGEAYSCWWSRTRRTARARSSGSIFFGMVLILLDSNRSGIKPGAVHVADCQAGAGLDLAGEGQGGEHDGQGGFDRVAGAVEHGSGA